ncbi:MAG: hypothetical protein ACHQAX_05330 [Gammaproteobacteria bacterium]
MKKEVFIFADYDGCIGAISRHPSEKAPATLFEANPRLNEHIASLSGSPRIARINWVNHSLRNGPGNDALNAADNRNGSALIEFDSYVEVLQAKCHKLHLRKLLMQDLALNKPAGWVWGQLKQQNWPHLGRDHRARLEGMVNGLYDEKYNVDRLKISLFFAHAWHCYRERLPGCEMQIQVFDDNLNILKSIASFYNFNKALLPPGIRIQFIHYKHHYNHAGVEETYICKMQNEFELNTKPSARQHPDFPIYLVASKLENWVTQHYSQLVEGNYPQDRELNHYLDEPLIIEPEPSCATAFFTSLLHRSSQREPASSLRKVPSTFRAIRFLGPGFF